MVKKKKLQVINTEVALYLISLIACLKLDNLEYEKFILAFYSVYLAIRYVSFVLTVSVELRVVADLEQKEREAKESS